ncbi:MAG: hypothetical protein F2658_02350 [Actinobacteria bacterium]|uniref:Unannotated protein n=1 Tax=freshwater metagenome TaxID=449393 RepID=A0A6J6N9W9_9ZZZZ|nr:hypothetical protein [Actinomycetota bacterium]
MVARAITVTLQQVIRSITLILFPLAFITLFAWATAGSTSGSTSDPIRAALWLWLGAHLSPFNISGEAITGYLSLLPLGALLLPVLAIRIGYRRSVERVGDGKSTRTYFLLWYLIIYCGLALIAGNAQASIDWKRGPITVLAILVLAIFSLKAGKALQLPFYLFLIMLGIAGLLFTTALAMNFETAKNLTVVLQPGIIGGALLLLLQLAYLPNIFIATLSYIFGAGIFLGTNTEISPLTFSLREIPAIPVLAALPAGEIPWLMAPTIMIFIFGWLNLKYLLKSTAFIKIKRQSILRFLVISIGGFAGLSALSSGSLITANMSPVGVNTAIACLIITAQLILVLLIQILLPKLIKALRSKGRVAS